MEQQAFQDLIPRNHCWGCGPLNQHGLQIKSYWSGEEAVCRWRPHPQHMAGPTTILNGGIIATIVDCHCVCTAIAAAYRAAGRAMDTEPLIWYATAAIEVTYRMPTTIVAPLMLRARIVEMVGRKTVVTCSLISEGEERAVGRVVAVRVPEEWRAE